MINVRPLAILGVTVALASAIGGVASASASARGGSLTFPAQGATAHADVTWGQMKNEGSGLCMSSLGRKTDGAPVRQERCNGDNNQYWHAEGQALGGIHLVNGDGWCLNNAKGSSANRNPQTMWPCSDGNYKDIYTYSGGANRPIHLAADGSNFKPNGACPTSDGSSAVGSPVVLSRCNYSNNQRWSGPIIFSGG